MLDIAATLENRKTRLQWATVVSSVIGIPLMVGGGIGSLEDIGFALDTGASRVSTNSAAANNPDLISTVAKRFGEQRVTVAIDDGRNGRMRSGLEVVIAGGTKPVGKEAVGCANAYQELGAGLVLPASMDGDGTEAGYCIEFTKAIADAVDLPVVASGGGAGRLEHFQNAVVRGGATVLLAASVVHYRTLISLMSMFCARLC